MKLFIKTGTSTYKIYKGSNRDLFLIGESSSSWRKGYQLEIKDLDNNTCLIINEKNSKFFQWPWNVKYILRSIADNKIFEISWVSIVKQHWKMIGEEHRYDYYPHAGHLKSIFKDDKQIAAVDRVDSDPRLIYIVCDSDENLLLLSGLVLTFEMGKYDDGYDLGNIGPQVKQFDTKWKPK